MENSKEAIEAAIEAGLPIEIDLQNTKDARAVVFHDEALERLTGENGYVRDKTLAEMEKLPLKKGGKTLSYADCLHLVAGRVPVLVEIKDQDGHLGPKLGSFLPDIIQQTRNYQGAIALMSFNPYIIQALRHELPEAVLGLTTDKFSIFDWPKVPLKRRNRLRKRTEVPLLQYDFISHNRADLERVRNVEMPKLCWTVKTEAQEEKARQIADNITFEGYMPKSA